ncbi:arylsulfatase [Vibrio sp. JCM 19236]|nr:arylsulfatase [Vibrio sp. JCM 19236]
MAAAGVPDVKEKLAKGYEANGKEWRVHIDGYNFKPYFEGKEDQGPRDSLLYFSANGELNAIRWEDWKLHFATLEGNITDAVRFQSNWPKIIHLRADPFEKAPHESGMYLRWMADNMWLFVPVQDELGKFFATLDKFPRQNSQVLNPATITQTSLGVKAKLDQIDELKKQVASMQK